MNDLILANKINRWQTDELSKPLISSKPKVIYDNLDKYLVSKNKNTVGEKTKAALNNLSDSINDISFKLLFAIRYNTDFDVSSYLDEKHYSEFEKTLSAKDVFLPYFPQNSDAQDALINCALKIGGEVGYRIISHALQNGVAFKKENQTNLLDSQDYKYQFTNIQNHDHNFTHLLAELDLVEIDKQTKQQNESKFNIENIKALSPEALTSHRIGRLRILSNLDKCRVGDGKNDNSFKQIILNRTFVDDKGVNHEQAKQTCQDSLTKALDTLSIHIVAGIATNMLTQPKAKLLVIPNETERIKTFNNMAGFWNEKNTSYSSRKVGTQIHEMCHFLVNSVFENNANPYRKNNNIDARTSYNKAVRQTLENCKTALDREAGNGQIIARYIINEFNVPEYFSLIKDKRDTEYIVRYFDILANISYEFDDRDLKKNITCAFGLMQPLTQWIEKEFNNNLLEFITKQNPRSTKELKNIIIDHVLKNRLDGNQSFFSKDDLNKLNLEQLFYSLSHNAKILYESGIKFSQLNEIDLEQLKKLLNDPDKITALTSGHAIEAIQNFSLPNITFDSLRNFSAPKITALTLKSSIQGYNNGVEFNQLANLYDKGQEIGRTLFSENMSHSRQHDTNLISLKLVELGIANQGKIKDLLAQEILSAPDDRKKPWAARVGNDNKPGLADIIYQNCTNYTKFGLVKQAFNLVGQCLDKNIQLNQNNLNNLTIDALLNQKQKIKQL